MIIAQICLITPIIIGLVYNGTKDKGQNVNMLERH